MEWRWHLSSNVHYLYVTVLFLCEENKGLIKKKVVVCFFPICYMVVCVCVVLSVEQCSNMRLCVYILSLRLVIVIQLSPAPAPSQRAGIIQSIALCHCTSFSLPQPPPTSQNLSPVSPLIPTFLYLCISFKEKSHQR